MSELQGLQSRIDDFRDLGYRIIAVSPDPAEDNRRVVARLKLDFPVLSDADLALTRELGLVHPAGAPDGSDVPRPGTYVLDNNRILWEHLTDNWRVRIAPDELLQAVRSL